MQFPKKVIIEEQGLRDGLQPEKTIVSTEKKLEIIRNLVAAGLKRLQVVSFVHPKWVPQMADAELLCSHLDHSGDIIYSGLVLNVKGVQRAVDSGLRHVAASISASNTHSQKNANMPLQEARRQFAEMVRVAKHNGLTVRGGLQCVFGCRFEGRIDWRHVLDMLAEQLDCGVDEIALADSTGMADPVAVQEISVKVVELAQNKPVFLHLHDTEGKGLANVIAALSAGISNFDTAFGGMGGCPFIKGASGNLPTEDLAFMLSQMGIQTGIDVRAVAAISRDVEAFIGKTFSGKMHKVLAREDIQILCA